jgi:hypothetical protein
VPEHVVTCDECRHPRAEHHAEHGPCLHGASTPASEWHWSYRLPLCPCARYVDRIGEALIDLEAQIRAARRRR